MSRLGRLATSLPPVLLLATSCAGATSRSPLPPPPQVVTVTMREYDFDYRPPTSPGRVVFRFVNEGRLVHQPDLLPLREDLPPIAEQLRGEQRAAVTPFAGIPPRDPGQVGSYAVDLAPGQRYAFICFAHDPDDDESHALQGMTSEFRAGGRAGAETTTTPSTTTSTSSTTTTTG